MSVPVTMIAAVAENGVIGNGNAIPWRLPSDFAHFKRMTMGKPLIIGRKTFESIGRPLPGRTSIVVTRRPDYHPEGVLVFASLEAAMSQAQAIAEASGADEIIIGGGAQIYAEAMPVADRLYVTHVALSPPGDTHFPVISPADWQETGEIAVEPSPKDTVAFAVRVYQRRPGTRR